MKTADVDSSSTADDTPDVKGSSKRLGDTLFSGLALAAGLTLVLMLAGVAAFLVWQGAPALDASGPVAYGSDSIWGFVWPLLFGTVLASLIAMLICGPLSIALALVISHYAPKSVARPVGYLVDLLAAVPSVVFGLWGVSVLAPKMVPMYDWLAANLGFIPLFAGPSAQTGKTIFTAGVVLAIMALPIVTAVCREIFSQTPRMNEEAALALGATKWEMIKMTVFPYSRSGIVSALMLGLGRALGETMAVAMVLSATAGLVSVNLISEMNPNTIAAAIANNYANASGLKVNTLVFAGLMLFVLTFVVNFLGRWIASRGQVKG